MAHALKLKLSDGTEEEVRLPEKSDKKPEHFLADFVEGDGMFDEPWVRVEKDKRYVRRDAVIAVELVEVRRATVTSF